MQITNIMYVFIYTFSDIPYSLNFLDKYITVFESISFRYSIIPNATTTKFYPVISVYFRYHIIILYSYTVPDIKLTKNAFVGMALGILINYIF